jgi:TPR repeat protein
MYPALEPKVKKYTIGILSLIGLVFGNSSIASPTSEALCLTYYQQHHYEQAFRSCKQAAEQNSAPAQFVLSQLYTDGKGVRANAELAQNWLERSGFKPLEEVASAAP